MHFLIPFYWQLSALYTIGSREPHRVSVSVLRRPAAFSSTIGHIYCPPTHHLPPPILPKLCTTVLFRHLPTSFSLWYPVQYYMQGNCVYLTQHPLLTRGKSIEAPRIGIKNVRAAITGDFNVSSSLILDTIFGWAGLCLR